MGYAFGGACVSFTVGAWNQHVWNPLVVMESWVKVRHILLDQRTSPYGEEPSAFLFMWLCIILLFLLFLMCPIPPIVRLGANAFPFSSPSLPGEDSQTVSYELAGQQSDGISKVCWPATHFPVPKLIVWAGRSCALLGRRRQECDGRYQ